MACILTSVYRSYRDALVSELRGYETILDVGAGENSVARFVESHKTALEIDSKKIETARKNQTHNVYLQGDARNLGMFDNKSFDAVIALDLIEHLEKWEGIVLLENMEAVASKKVIICTPNGFVEQKNDDQFDEHKSGWTVQDFRKRGYNVYGLYGLKGLRRERGTPVFGIVGEILSALTQFFVWKNPELAYQLFAVKEI